MKIHIIGGPGSGKTYLANELSGNLGIPHFDLDELQWDNQSGDYGTKRDPNERDVLLDKILQQDDWIIEGVYYSWCKKCFEQADRIYLLSVPRHIYRYCIIRRFVRRKIGIQQNGIMNLEAGSEEEVKNTIIPMGMPCRIRYL